MISINSMTLKVLILGAGGHARVLIDALLASSAFIAGIFLGKSVFMVFLRLSSVSSVVIAFGSGLSGLG